jgi:GTP-binding protein
MKITRADLLAVAVKEDQYPPVGPPEIAFAGRSNVGKSSLLNLLTGRKGLAKTSGTPGKTRTINFYAINADAFRIVDLPGYGYAKIAKSESAKWGAMMERYLSDRPTLKQVVQLVDIRHEPSVQDRQMCAWLRHFGLDGLVVATKADKVSVGAVRRFTTVIQGSLGVEDASIIPVSALKRTGTSELLAALEEVLKRD